MKWFVLCLAVAGLSTSALAAPQPALSPDHAKMYGVQLAQGQCPPPKVMDAAGRCVCPPGTHQSPAAANACVPDSTCPPPRIMKDGRCVCPPGTVQTPNGDCSKCPPPKVINADGRCVCPPGTHQGAAAANVCIADTCPPPKVMDAAGQCVCPRGEAVGPNGQCMAMRCPPGMIGGPNGRCTCPKGTVMIGNRCVECQPPKIPNADGKCVCPPGTKANPLNGMCVKG